MMSYLEMALRTEQAKQAYGAGIVRFIETGSIDEGLRAIEQEARRNGSWDTAKIAFVLDNLKKLAIRF